jgi:MoxR-like ATPase
MLFATTGTEEDAAEPVLTSAELTKIQHLVRLMPIGESLAEAILKIVRAARPGSDADDFINKNVGWGPSPRASQALMLGSRARALLDGRLAPSVEDVLALASPVFRHRMALNFTARADGVAIDHVIEHLKNILG